MRRTPTLDFPRPGRTLLPGSGRAGPRHPGNPAYGCSLPGLTRFTGSRRVGPDLHCPSGRPFPDLRSLRWEFSPAYGGFRVQGTADPPPSAAQKYYAILYINIQQQNQFLAKRRAYMLCNCHEPTFVNLFYSVYI